MANDALRYSLVQKLKLPDTLTSWQDERIGTTYWGYL